MPSLSSAATAADTVFFVDEPLEWEPGWYGRAVLVLEPGSSAEEAVLVRYTVNRRVYVEARGAPYTRARPHPAGARVVWGR